MNRCYRNNIQPTCTPTCQSIPGTTQLGQTSVCPVVVTIESDTCCARPCEDIRYTIQVCNHCSEEIINPILNIALAENLCYICNSLEVNCEPRQMKRLECIKLRNICPGETLTITFTAKIMTNDRYIRTSCMLDYTICCCCERKAMRTCSNVSVVQCCGCCGGSAV